MTHLHHADALDDICHPAGAPSETKARIDARQRAWATFREVNDRRHDLAARGQADPLLDEQLDRINADLDGPLETKATGHRRLAGGDATVKRAVVEIGKEVLRQGRVIDRSAAAGRFGGFKAAAADRRAAHAGRSFADRLSALEAKRHRPHALGMRTLGPGHRRGTGGYMLTELQRAHRKAVVNYIRTGETHFGGMSMGELERKAMHTELNPAGGFLLLPERADSPLSTFLLEVSRMRQRATVRPIMTDTFEQPTKLSKAEGGWRAERAPVTGTDTPTLGTDTYTVHELWAQPATTQKLLDDATLDVEAWLTAEVVESFSEQESDAWFNGNGLVKPRGLLTYPFVTPANWAHGSFRYVATGASGTFPVSDPADKLLELVYAIKSPHRAKASWLFNRTTIGVIRRFKDTTGQYLWQPSTQAGQPDMLLGYVTDEDEFMPDIGVDTFAVAFGDWAKTYLILDRVGVRVLRDPYTIKGQVSFYTTKRVGGAVAYFDAAVFLKFGTS